MKAKRHSLKEKAWSEEEIWKESTINELKLNISKKSFIIKFTKLIKAILLKLCPKDWLEIYRNVL